MKQLFSLISLLILSVVVFAQGGKKPANSTSIKPAVSATDLKTLLDSISYAVGVSVANFYKQQGIKNLNGTLISNAINDVFSDIDLIIGSALNVTNLTGHPEITLPHGFDAQGQPTSLHFTGKLFGEEDLLILARTFQSKTEFHLKRPKL